MSFKKLIVSTVAAATLVTGAIAGDRVDGINVAADKTGDYLLFPTYYANSVGWKTDLRVVNTDPDNSVIAKVVLREGRLSNEKRDFIIYLSPGDVWEALVYEENGAIKISSNDDSMIVGGISGDTNEIVLTFPADQDLSKDIKSCNGKIVAKPDGVIDEDSTNGYIEVFGVVKFAGTIDWLDESDKLITTSLTKAPVNKYALYRAFAKQYDDASIIKMPVGNQDLTGQAIVYADNDKGQLAMTYTATAFEGFVGDYFQGPSRTLGKDTKLFDMVENNDVCTAVNGMENALDKSSTYVIHYSKDDGSIAESKLVATFPTKKYRLDEGGAICPINAVFQTKSTPDFCWTESADYQVEYSGLARDMKERYETVPDGEISGDHVITIPDTCDREVCGINVANNMDGEGYVQYSFYGAANQNPMPYDSKLMSAKAFGGKNVTNMISPAYTTPSKVLK